MNTKKIVYSALFAALCCVATFVIRIPIAGGGYINAGDILVIASGWLLGPLFGPLAAGIGSAVADIMAGFVLYSPATFIIKGVMALIVAVVSKNAAKLGIKILTVVIAEIVMVGGYLLYEYFLIGIGSAAFLNMVPNLIQAAVGGVVSVVLWQMLYKKLNLYLKGDKNGFGIN